MSVVDAILQKLDIVDIVGEHVELHQSSRGYTGKCNLHDGDGTDTLWVTPDTGTFYCFSCEASGNSISYYAQLYNLGFYEAINKLCESLNIDLSNNRSYQEERNLVKEFTLQAHNLQKKIGMIEDYLIGKRGLTKESIALHKLGYDENKHAISIPLIDIYGRVVGMAFRNLESEPKYINSKNNDLYDKSKYLYNLVNARKHIRKTGRLWLVEGYFDAEVGEVQEEAVAGYCSASINKGHILEVRTTVQNLKNIEIIIASDFDDAGQSKIPKVRDKFRQYYPKANLRVALRPNDTIKDFNDLHLAGLRIADLETMHVDKFVLGQLLSKCKSPEEEYSVAQEFSPTITNDLIKSDIAEWLSVKWKKPLDKVEALLNVKADSKVENVLAEFATVGQSIDKYLTTMEDDGNGIGFPKIDFSFGGVQKKEVFLIGAYSKIGKTDFICEIILHSILRLHMNCLMFSMEMPKEGIIRRLLMKLFNVTKRKLKEMMKSPESANYITEAREKLEKYLVIVDTNNLSMEEIKYRVKVANDRIFDTPVRRVFVDYFQYMKGTTEFAEIEASAKSMKPFCKDMDIELYMLSQFSRNDRPWERPSIASFKGGNSLESSFDKCVLLWRPSKNPKLSEIERDVIKYQTMVAIESREEMYGEDTFELAYDPETSRLLEKDEIEELRRQRLAG
jgi:DNA primase